jgi:hypothetical protein
MKPNRSALEDLYFSSISLIIRLSGLTDFKSSIIFAIELGLNREWRLLALHVEEQKKPCFRLRNLFSGAGVGLEHSISGDITSISSLLQFRKV